MGSVKRGGSFSFFLVMIVALVVYSVPLLRDGIGQTMDLIIGPLVSGAGVSWLIVILVLSTITGCYSSLLQKYTIDYDKMKRVQKKMKEFQKVFREAQLAGDEKKLKKLNEKRDKMMQEQLEMSQEQFKPMAWIMMITVPIFLWLLFVVNVSKGAIEVVPPHQIYDLGSITFPYWGAVNFADTTPFLIPAWIIWYMICSLTMSQVIRKALNIGGI